MALISGTSASEILNGTSNSDTIDGKGGNDRLIGAAGNDFYDFSGTFGNDRVEELANQGTDTLRIASTIPAGSVRIVGDSLDDLIIIADGFGSIRLTDHLIAATVEALQIGAAAPISLTGGLTMTGAATSDTIHGTRFNDTLDGKGGTDTLVGRLGDDSYVFSGTFGADRVTELANEGTDTLRIASTIPAGSVRIVGDSADDLVVFADGFGSIRLADHLVAAKVEFLQIGSATPISLTGGLTMTGAATSDTIHGTRFNDTFDGKGGTDTLVGRLGDDSYVFSGSFGADRVTELANEGTDTLRIASTIPAGSVRIVGDSADDLVVFADGFGSVRLADHLLAAKVEFLQIGSATPISLTGGLTMTGDATGDTIHGTGFNDTLDGKGGSDVLVGRLGNDSYLFSGTFGADRVTELANEGTDTLRIASTIPASSVRIVGDGLDDLVVIADGFGSIRLADHLLAAKVEFLQIGSATPISLTGGLTMTGTAGSESIFGTAFNDTIEGKAGSDTLNGGAGTDTASYASAGAAVTVSLALQGTLQNTVGAGSDRLSGFENLTGSNFNDTLTGDAGGNVINGGSGADRMVGAAGSDTYVVDSSSDTVVEAAGGGTDTVQTGLGFTLGAEVENLRLTGTGAVNGSGNALPNSLSGNAAANILNGKAGADTMTGGAGNDGFTFDTALGASNVDRIADFAGVNDQIRLDDAVFTRFAGATSVAAANFAANAGGNAVDANDYLLYDTAAGRLYYDADGNGAGARVLFATLDNLASVSAADFTIV